MARESALASDISDPPSARSIKVGEKSAGLLSKLGTRLPDGSFGDYYFIEIKKPGSLIRIKLEGEKGLNPLGCVYHNNRLVSTFTCSLSGGMLPSYFNVMQLNQGKTVLFVTARKQSGRYTIWIEEPDEATRSMMNPRSLK